MNLPVSVPSDSFYKFLAISGLVLVVTAFWGVITQGTQTNDIVFTSAPEISALEANQAPTPGEKTRLEVLKKRLQAAVDDKKTISNYCTVLAALGTLIGYIGFSLWYTKIQKHQDRLLNLQVLDAERKERQASASELKTSEGPGDG